MYGLVSFVAFILMVQLYSLQVLKGSDYRDQAEKHYVTPQGGVFDRGSIYFKNKDGQLISAATLKTGFILIINPSLIVDPKDTYKKLSEIVDLEVDAFYNKANKKDDTYEELAEKLDEETAKKIEALNIDGVDLKKQKWRFYPGGELASRTLGFVAFDENVLDGRYGVEKYYDDLLTREGNDLYINFFAEIFSNVKDRFLEGKKKGEIVLSIEPSVQLFLESELKKVGEKWNTDSAVGVVLDPKTGKIYALAIDPGFDLNNFQEEKDNSIFSNSFVENVFEMGSIIKPLTMAIGLDTKSVTAETTYNDKGSLLIDGAKISNYDGKARGIVPMQEVLNQSLNTGVVFVMQETGKEKFAEYMLKLGIGEETGIDLPNETYGLVNNLKSPRDLEYATASFGQGIALTPVETVRALSALANGGKLITPHLTEGIKYRVGLARELLYDDGDQVFKESTSEEITRMLVEVVDKALMGGTVKMEHYSIAAKTGTAQMAKEDGRGYYDDKYLHSFFGYFPAYNPEFLVFFYIINPKEVKYASSTLTEPFMNTAKFLINYYEIPPDR